MAFQKLGWSLVLGLFLASCSSNEGILTDEPIEVSGAQLYQENCVICHGDDGKAGISGATDLSMSSLSEDSIKHYILQGKKSMPPFSFLFEKDNEALKDVITHVKELRAK
ncbi:MAG: c-type cytochrome [Crocinitomicaceae bacterium]